MSALNDQVKRCQYVTPDVILSDVAPVAPVSFADMGLLPGERPDAVVPFVTGVSGNVTASMVVVEAVTPTSALLRAVPTPAAGTAIKVAALVVYTHSILGDHQNTMPLPPPP